MFEFNFFKLCFSKSSNNCSKIREEISVFDTLFNLINYKLNESLSLKYNSLTYNDAVLYSNDIEQRSEKDFLNLIVMQGRNNVSEVKVIKFFKSKMSCQKNL
jgi:hypothetical protein